MQKILQVLHSEMAVAIKDRPAAFQIITLALFSFAVTVILISSFAHFSTADKAPRAAKASKNVHYANFASAPAGNLLPFKK